MQLTNKKHYLLELNHDELLLVSKALGGRLQDNDIAQAKNLDNLLAHQRIKIAEHDYHELKKLKENMSQ